MCADLREKARLGPDPVGGLDVAGRRHILSIFRSRGRSHVVLLIHLIEDGHPGLPVLRQCLLISTIPHLYTIISNHTKFFSW